MRLLITFIQEPLPGNTLPQLATDVGPEKATRFTKALTEVLLRQLQGLNNTRIRFCYTPNDASDAIRFWLLPEMHASAGPEKNLYLAPPSQEIDFHPQGEGNHFTRLQRAATQGIADGFHEIAIINSNCPDCGARWINATFSRLDSPNGGDLILGHPSNQHDPTPYLIALKKNSLPVLQTAGSIETLAHTAEKHSINLETLPPLPTITTGSDWQQSLSTPLGPALKKYSEKNR